MVGATLTDARTQTMYDLDVAIVDTFAVGDGAWVVHNVDGCPPFGLTNFDSDVSKNIEFNTNSLDSIVPNNAGDSFGAGWTGAFDMETRKFVAIPSDPMYTRTIDDLDDLVYLPGGQIGPENLQAGIVVGRTGGHGTASQILRLKLNLKNIKDADGRIIGLNMSYWNPNVLTMGWKSNGLNMGSPYATGNLVAPKFHEQIIGTIRQVMPPNVQIRNP